MTKRVKPKRLPQGPAAAGPAPPASRSRLARRLALAGLTALLVATPLVPSEAAAELGTGSVFAMLWVLLLVAWSGGALALRQREICVGPTDVLVAVFFGLVSLSALLTVSAGDVRAAVNMLWQWLTFGIAYFLSRQLLRTQAERRAISVVMIGATLGLATLGYYQYFYSMPKTRAEYARDPQGMLQAAGIDSTVGSPEAKLLEDRLNSTEPTATFALANSLAGLLAPWLIVALGIGLSCWDDRLLRSRTLSGALLVCSYLGFCLLLTKSRAALLATAGGVVLLALWRWRTGRRLDWRVPVAGLTIVAILVAAVIAAGAFDLLVLTETPKSVLYRLQYWQSTLNMIADHPWFGCGAGNFQDFYTAYKLPEASETVADPHNLLLEVWATLGTPAALAFLAVCASALWPLLRRGGSAADARPGDAARKNPTGNDASWGWIYAGAAVGTLLGVAVGFIVGFPADTAILWLGVPVAATGVAVLHRWTAAGDLPVWLPTIAIVVLAANLLAAGGISFAGVAQTWWLLTAMMVNSVETRQARALVPRAVVAIGCLVSVILAVVCFQTGYSPVLRCRMRLDEGEAFERTPQLALAEEAIQRAAAADPYWAEPWIRLASIKHRLILAGGDETQLAGFDRAVAQALRRKSRSHTLFRRIGDWRLALYAAGGQPRQRDLALAAYQQWVRLYPNSSLGHAQLAWAYRVAGDREAAAREAGEALRLDALNPHRERKLVRQHLFDPTAAATASQNAEQQMFDLRK